MFDGDADSILCDSLDFFRGTYTIISLAQHDFELSLILPCYLSCITQF